MVGIGMMVVFSVHVCGAPGFLTGMVGGGGEDCFENVFRLEGLG